jgi:hypothetical protein
MKIMGSLLIVAALLICAPVFAQIKPCEELKTEIEGKLKDKGVVNFSLEIVPADQIKDQKVVGSCDGGKSKITYSKDGANKEESKPAKKE